MGTHNIVCHFCSMQDMFGLSGDRSFESVHFGVQNLVRPHYFSQKRICPRGNFCVELVQHAKRTAYPKVGEDIVKTAEAFEFIKSRLAEVDKTKTAFFLSGSLTLEETYAVARLAQKWGTRWVSLIYPEDYVVASFKNNFDLQSLAESKIIVAIGDLFSLHPTIAKFVHDARFAERKNFLAVIDSARSRTSWFAWSFLGAKPGRVADVVEALAKAVLGQEYSIDGTGVDKGAFETLAESLRNTDEVAILFAPGAGRFAEPLRIGYWAEKLALERNFGFCAFGTGANGRGIARLLTTFGFAHISETVNAVAEGRADAVFCLGCDPVEAFPKIYGGFSDAKLKVAVASLPTSAAQMADVLIPEKHLFEKTGSLLSLSEDVYQMQDCYPVPDYPGSGGLVEKLLDSEGESAQTNLDEIKLKLDEFNFIEEAPQAAGSPEAEIFAVGYCAPYHHGDGSLTRRASWVIRTIGDRDNAVLIGPALAEKLGIKKYDPITVRTDGGEGEFYAVIQEDLGENVVMVPMYMPQGRSLMGWRDVAGFVPVPAKVSKA